MKASQAISGEIVLGDLVAPRSCARSWRAPARSGGLLLLFGDERRAIELDPDAGRDADMLPEATLDEGSAALSILRWVERTRESVVLGRRGERRWRRAPSGATRTSPPAARRDPCSPCPW